MMSDALRDPRRRDEGFTLIELLVVVVILGILIGIAVPVYLNYRKSAQDKSAQSDVRGAISTFEVCSSNGGYPLTVAATGASATMTGCASQTLTKAANTVMDYRTTPGSPSATAPVVSYIIFATSVGGSNKIYCYDSRTGGSLQTSATATTSTAPSTIPTTASCP